MKLSSVWEGEQRPDLMVTVLSEGGQGGGEGARLPGAARAASTLKPGELALLRGEQDTALALAPQDAAQARALGVAAARLARELRAGGVRVDGAPAALAAELALGALLGSYRFTRYKADEDQGPQQFSVGGLDDAALARVQARAAGVTLARDLVNTPYNDLGAEGLERAARQLADEYGLTLEVWDQQECARRGLGLFCAVGQGSADPPRFIRLTYRPSGEPTRVTALVGKGVMFDSGGYSLKTAAGMYGMKGDMGGAAAVLGAMRAVAALKPGAEVRAYIPATDNAVSGSAMRPGDIFRALNGKTVEVTNTDAEGRLILADALTVASQEGADEVIDIATLTGAKVTALGGDVAALFSSDRPLADAVRAAAGAVQEPVWELPLHAPYLKGYSSGMADLKNSDMTPAGGSVKAALFLQQFVSVPWAHLDIAGNELRDQPHDLGPAGATGFGALLLTELASRE